MKTTELQKVFNFNPANQQIRVEVIDNEAWFVAKDVCEVLGHTNPSVAVQLLDEDERTKKSLGRDFQRIGNDITWLVNESGLYNLIFRSNKPKARAFRKWVTSEVLPTIRKTGKYEPRQNGAIMYYKPANNAELMHDFRLLAYQQIVKIDNKRVRNRLARLVDYAASKMIDL